MGDDNGNKRTIQPGDIFNSAKFSKINQNQEIDGLTHPDISSTSQRLSTDSGHFSQNSIDMSEDGELALLFGNKDMGTLASKLFYFKI
jgi:hypothetical protein